MHKLDRGREMINPRPKGLAYSTLPCNEDTSHTISWQSNMMIKIGP
uniref:Uncharacterized protein n=1 Tax=Arundo donax TaxID=35708 RepID=A0A0A8ZI16_ARUDO